MEIIPVDYGISSRYDDYIEINRKLIGTKLYHKIIKHEEAHSSGKYNKNDWKTDFNSKDPYFWETVKFCFKNPEGWINFFFIMYSYLAGCFTYNLTALMPLVLWGLIFSGMSWLFFGVGFINSLIIWACIYVVLNIIALAYTHSYVRKVNPVWTTARSLITVF